MLFQKIIYCIKAALKNLNKNLIPNIIAFSTISISFVIFTSFLLLIINFSSFNQTWAEQIQVVVYFKHAAPSAVITQAYDIIKKDPDVDSVISVSSQEAFNILKNSLKGQNGILSGLSGNALPASLEVKLKKDRISVSAVESFVGKIKNINGIEDIQYGQQWLERFLILFEIIKIIGFILGSLLFLFTLFIISNTIKLLVYNRREEIEIMKLVGATNAFIKLPFFIEGVLQGIIGASIALLFLAVIIGLFDEQFVSFARIYLGNFSFVFINTKLILSILGLGVILGFIGSTFALQSIDEFKN